MIVSRINSPFLPCAPSSHQAQLRAGSFLQGVVGLQPSQSRWLWRISECIKTFYLPLQELTREIRMLREILKPCMEHSFLSRNVQHTHSVTNWPCLPIIALYSFSKTSSSKPILLYRRTDRILRVGMKSKLSKQGTSYPETVLALKAMACSSECSLNSLLLRNFLPHIVFLDWVKKSGKK